MISKLIFTAICITAVPCSAQKFNPCPDGPNVSNVEMRECYTKAQTAMNKAADDLVMRITAGMRATAPKEKEEYGPVILDLIEKGAKTLQHSQVSWREYRDQYCESIRLSYTTGSGAGTAWEECYFTLASARVQQLKKDFPDWAHNKVHQIPKHSAANNTQR